MQSTKCRDERSFHSTIVNRDSASRFFEMDKRKDNFLGKVNEMSNIASSVTLTKSKYDELIQRVMEVKSKSTKKTPSDFWLLRQYDVIEVMKVRKLIYPMKDGTDIRYYVHNDELFETLETTHKALGHGGRDRMEREIRKKFKNVSRATIQAFIAGCVNCEKKKSNKRKGLVVKPIVHANMNSRAQLDLIDMQSDPDGDYRFIFVYQDHLTKFVVLKPLRNKTANEVAVHLLDVFTLFGAPCILQTDNGREFKNAVVESVQQLWPELKIVHGKARHSQSQGSVERANRDVEEMLYTWLRDQDKESQKWSEGLRFVQFMKNRSLHSGIRRSPYEAMFGVPARIGLEHTTLPREMWHLIENEEDLQEALDDEGHVDEYDDELDCEPAQEVARNTAVEEGAPPLCNDYDEMRQESDPPDQSSSLDSRKRAISQERAGAQASLLQQAKRMKRGSDAKFPEPAIGATVRVPVPDVDRGKLGGR